MKNFFGILSVHSNKKLFMIRFLVHLIVSALTVMIAAYILPGINVDGFFAALVTAVVIGIVNAFLKPFLTVITLPITILTLGLFSLIVNALLVELVAAIVPGFHVASFGSAVLFRGRRGS
jgi:putative membrane protein